MIRDPDIMTGLLDSVRRFVRERLVPAEEAVAETDAIPDDIVRDMKALGLFGLTIPESYGGLGLTMEEEALVMFELCQTAPAFRSLIGTTVGIGSQGILIDGTPEQKDRWLPALARGELIASFALTEPESGSDAASIRTRARRDGEHYVIDGTKRFITNAPEAGMFTLMARTSPDDEGTQANVASPPGLDPLGGRTGAGRARGQSEGITAFIVDAKTPGISLGRIDRKMGQKGAHTCDVIFDGVRVPAANVIGGVEGRGFKTAMKVLDKGRIHIAAVCVGVAQRLLRDTLRYAMERKQFGQPIAEFQLVQAMLADSRTELYAAQAMVLDAARRRDAGEDVSTEAACCKYYASEMVGRVADRAVQVHGGAGYVTDHGIERYYRDVRLFRIYEGTSQIQQIVIARGMVKAAQAMQ